MTLCDASPLIFLGKSNLLELLFDVPGGELVVMECVFHEVMASPNTASERQRYKVFFEKTQIISHPLPSPLEGALSRCDRASLEWAVAHKVEWMVVDERLLRKVAMAAGLKVVGFLGILIESVHRGQMSKDKAKRHLDDAIKLHGYRISVRLYQEVLSRLES